jgi:hypothetical protein
LAYGVITVVAGSGEAGCLHGEALLRRARNASEWTGLELNVRWDDGT